MSTANIHVGAKQLLGNHVLLGSICLGALETSFASDSWSRAEQRVVHMYLVGLSAASLAPFASQHSRSLRQGMDGKLPHLMLPIRWLKMSLFWV